MRDNHADPGVLLVGISGPSSSGKTTLSRLLRDVIPDSFILHEDDFYKPDSDIPIRSEDGIADWDCLDSLNLPALAAALAHIKANATPPPDLVSKEDQNSVGEVELEPGVVQRLTRSWETYWSIRNARPPRVAIIDGLLLFGKNMPSIRAQFDAKLFLRADYDTVKRRREARTGYVTIEGFWEDPPGYVDKVVWPNYVADHSYLFVGGDVQGEVDESIRKDVGIDVMPREADGDMTRCLTWAFELILEAVTKEEDLIPGQVATGTPP